MGRVSRKNLDKELRKELEEQLAFIISTLTNKEEINVFLTEFLTSEEKIMLGKRLILYMMLLRGTSSKDIHTTLLMSYETIRWYKEMYNTKNSVFQSTVEKLLEHENNKKVWQKVENLLVPLDLILKSKRDIKARSKFAKGEWFNE